MRFSRHPVRPSPRVIRGILIGEGVSSSLTKGIRIGATFVFKSAAGGADEDVFEGGFAEGDGADKAGEGFDELGDELVPAIALDAERVVDGDGFDLEFIADGALEGGGVGGGEGDDVSTDLFFEGGGGAGGDELAVIEDGEAVAVFGFVHEVGGDEDGDAIALADFQEVFPEVDAGTGVEAGAGFIEQQDARAVEQAFGELDAPAHAAAESADVFARALGKTDAAQHLINALFEGRAGEAIEMALVAEVFFGGQLLVETGGLEDDADLAADEIALGFEVEAQEVDGAIAQGDEGGEDSEEGCFTAAIGAEKAEDGGGGDGEVEVAKGDAVAVGVG
jgi:hypothetical protein